MVDVALPDGAVSELIGLARIGLMYLDEQQPILEAGANHDPAVLEVAARARATNLRYRAMLDDIDGRSVHVRYERPPYVEPDDDVGDGLMPEHVTEDSQVAVDIDDTGETHVIVATDGDPVEVLVADDPKTMELKVVEIDRALCRAKQQP